MLYGSLVGIDRTIKILHAIGYADPNDWNVPIPVPPSAEGAATAQWMVIMTKTVLLEERAEQLPGFWFEIYCLGRSPR
jgi:hypothetical protein